MRQDLALESNRPYFYYRHKGTTVDWVLVSREDMLKDHHLTYGHLYEYKYVLTVAEEESLLQEIRQARNRASCAEQEYDHLCDQIRNLVS